jgi:hypothetical protein
MIVVYLYDMSVRRITPLGLPWGHVSFFASRVSRVFSGDLDTFFEEEISYIIERLYPQSTKFSGVMLASSLQQYTSFLRNS